MSPRLARRDYFLRVLNEPAAIHRERLATAGPLVGETYRLLCLLAGRVKDGTLCTGEEIAALNRVFEAENAVRLALVVEEDESDPLTGGIRQGPLRRAALQARLRGQAGDDGQRVYLEAIVSLLEALEAGDLELAVCAECGAWFIPYSRAPVARFCSARCRNHFNYKLRRGAVQVTP